MADAKTEPSGDAKELEWQAESDASTLTRVQELKSDAKRYKRAVGKLKQTAKDAMLAAAAEGVKIKFRNLKKGVSGETKRGKKLSGLLRKAGS